MDRSNGYLEKEILSPVTISVQEVSASNFYKYQFFHMVFFFFFSSKSYQLKEKQQFCNRTLVYRRRQLVSYHFIWLNMLHASSLPSGTLVLKGFVTLFFFHCLVHRPTKPKLQRGVGNFFIRAMVVLCGSIVQKQVFNDYIGLLVVALVSNVSR